MKSAHQIAFLNLIFITLNCLWIIIVDAKKIYGSNIYETFFHNWSYLTPHIVTFNIWKIITIVLVITAIFYCILLKRENPEDAPLAEQVEKSGNWVIINQLFLGMSMVFKMNDNLALAYACSLMTYYSLTRLNIIFKIRDYTNPAFIHIFTRTSLGLYSGWFIYLLGFNGIPILSNIFQLPASHYLFFYIALLFLIFSVWFVWYKAILCRLPALLLGYAVGVLGAYYHSTLHQVSSIYHIIMQYCFLAIVCFAVLSMFYLLYKKRKLIHLQD